MRFLLSPNAGERHFLLGNEAIVRGALEAGVVVATTYPGTPSSEIGDTLSLLSDGGRYYFEYSTNEKVAMEVAYGASMAGARSLTFMKHVGINVAADPMMTLVYAGTPGGMVIVSADDPSCHSSQNEQDNRYYARLGKMPMLEPSTPDEARRMMKYAFELSEEVHLPVFFRTTTRLNHMRGIVEFDVLLDEADLKKKYQFQRNPSQMVCVPGNAKKLHPVLLKKVEKTLGIVERDKTFNFRLGSGPIGILTSGVSFNYVMDAITELELTDRVEVARVGFTHPIPRKWLGEFLQGKEAVLVVEELEPYFEEQLRVAGYDLGLEVPIYGKISGHLPYHYEYSVEQVAHAIAKVAGVEHKMPEAVGSEHPLPSRPPNLCAGCAHRATFYAAKLVTKNKAIYHTDIGCYALAVLPPLNLADVLISMGSSINTASGISRVTDEPSIAFIGDSTFFHNGITGLVNALHNQHKQVVVVVDNGTTGMTGHQPHPGTSRNGMRQEAPRISIERLCRGLDIEEIYTVDPFDLQATIEAFERAVANPKLTVIVSRSPCIFINRKEVDARPRYFVDTEMCRFCGSHRDHVGCGEERHFETQMARAICRVRAMPEKVDPATGALPLKPPVAPCVRACPVSLCVQSYVTQIASGRYADAARAIREKIPLPATVGRVCHHPCEEACTRAEYDDPVAICALKRFVMESESHDEVASTLASRLEQAPERSQRVAVIGGGPAGLACAHDLRLRGYPVTVFEAADRLGGMLTLGIPAFRLPRDVVDAEIGLLVDTLGIEVRLGRRFGADITLESLSEEGFRATFLACGAWTGMKLGVEGEEGEGVYDALTFLKQVNQGERVELGARVAVIGGGDAAIDAARTARRLTGGQVTILYRRTEAEMPAQPDEIQHARDEGVEVRFLTAPIKVLREDSSGRLAGLRLIQMKLGESDSSGRRRPIPIPGSESDISLDAVIAAIGQRPDSDLFPEALELTDWGTIRVDPHTNATNLAGLFAGGDTVTGPKTVIDAMAAGQVAAFGIDRFLAGESAAPRPHRVEPDVSGEISYRTGRKPSGRRVAMPSPAHEEPQGDSGGAVNGDFVASARGDSSGVGRGDSAEESVREDAVEPSPRQNKGLQGDFSEVDRGYAEQEALEEAARCLACGMCASCNICLDTLACPAFYIRDGVIAIDEALCNGCGLCAQLCPNGAIKPLQLSIEV